MAGALGRGMRRSQMPAKDMGSILQVGGGQSGGPGLMGDHLGLDLGLEGPPGAVAGVAPTGPSGPHLPRVA